MPIKIAIVLLKAYAVFRPDRRLEFGGAETQMYLLSRELARDSNFEVTLICRDDGQDAEEIIDGVRLLKIDQGGAWGKRHRLWKRVASVRGLYRAARAVDADIYLQSCAGIETGIIAYYCRRAGKPCIFRAASNANLDGTFERTHPLPYRWSFRYGLRRCDPIICQNETQIDLLKARLGRDGLLLPSLCQRPETDHRPEGDVVLWVSRLIPMKRAEIFLRLARAMPERRFVMVASRGPNADYFDHITTEAETIQNLDLVRNVPYQEINRYFDQARILVNTSEYEGFPNIFLQAMSRGTPVVSMVVNPNGILTEQDGGVLTGEEEPALRDGVQRLWDDENLYARKSKAASAYVAQHHDVNTVTERYKELFRTLIETKTTDSHS